MLHRTNMTARLSCLITAAVLAAGLVCAVLSCDGIGTSVNSDGSPYDGTGGNSGSGGTGGSGGNGSGGITGSGGTGNFTVEELLFHASADNADAIRDALSDSGGNKEVGTFMVVLPAADISLPAGGSVTLSITGDGYNYYGTAQDAGDGIVSFEAPCIAVGTTVTVTLEVMKADGSITATGTATQRVTEGGCNFSIALVDTAPAPAPEGFVLVGDLYVCIHEVTQAEYEAYCSYGGSSPSAAYGVGPDYPAYYVSWYDALVYCNKRSLAENLTPCYTISGSTDPAVWGIVPSSSNADWNAVTTMDTSADGYRLPTEAEWLQAADDGHDYSGSNTAGDVAWYSGNSGDGGGSYTSGGKTHLVKTQSPNSAGIYDMSGNVNEWCWDIGTSSNRVYRGGSWDMAAAACTVSTRTLWNPSNRNNYIGFRLVRKAPAP